MIKMIKITMLTIIAVTMALTLILTTKPSNHELHDAQPATGPAFLDRKTGGAKRVSRFLQEKEKNPRAADHCHKDNDIGQCVNLAYDKRHCGACNHRCMPGGYCIYGMCDYA
ncbi:hypothetical protein Sango_2036300 [Sesamum angolense]|uniref:Stigma-specific Stig1 family protein n=1 Tax=Sesamum angolense TaxID=2727404 RepID=A0AAE2BPA0_9LAMI|nr:hypothetical protein Sango_2036300 [Sesamum angolense]